MEDDDKKWAALEQVSLRPGFLETLKTRYLPAVNVDYKPLRINDGFEALVTKRNIWNLLRDSPLADHVRLRMRKGNGGLQSTKKIASKDDADKYIQITELPGEIESFHESFRIIKAQNENYFSFCVFIAISDFDVVREINGKKQLVYKFFIEQLVSLYLDFLFSLGKN